MGGLGWGLGLGGSPGPHLRLFPRTDLGATFCHSNGLCSRLRPLHCGALFGSTVCPCLCGVAVAPLQNMTTDPVCLNNIYYTTASAELKADLQERLLAHWGCSGATCP